MASLKIRTLGLPNNLTDKLSNQNIITVKDFLTSNFIELQRKTGLTYQKLAYITDTINKLIAPDPIQASQLSHPFHIQFHNELDIFLKGGIKCGVITEISGSPGIGKTQLCLQLAVSNTLCGQVNGVLYIDSEGAFSPTRLLQIGANKYGIDSNQKMETCMKRIHVWRPENLNEISEKMITIEALLIKHKVGLLIIDSIGSIVRRQYGPEQSVERGTKLCSISSSLKQIAHTYNIAVVVTNHVTTKLSDIEGNSGTVIPALGPSWSHWINSRLHLTIVNNKRFIVVAKSPELPETMFAYYITDGGVELDVDSMH